MKPEIIQKICTKSGCYTTNVRQKALPPSQQNSDYRTFYGQEKPLLILHSLGCARDSADVQAERWDNPNGQAIAHACVDARDGKTRQTLPWDFRGWHAGQAGNNVAIGVEMAESLSIRYIGSTDRFEIMDKERARANCKAAYDGAVELFAYLCQMFGVDPLGKREIGGKTFPAVLGHCEWNRIRGVAGHSDPEHYWQQLGMDYTMDGFRADVAALLRQVSQEPTPEPEPELDGNRMMYRVQVGAFRNLDYAEEFLEQVRKHFPYAYIKASQE